MSNIISQLRNAFWGLPTLAFLLTAGIYFSVKSGFFFPKAVFKTARDTVFSLGKQRCDGISPFKAVATALGGTVGVGSIVGVGYGIAVGGAGSIFWMWVCSFFGMGLKYAEVKIALNKIEYKGQGGAHVRLFGLGYKKMAVFFCLVCVLASFGTGNITQVGAMKGFFGALGIDMPITAVIIALCVAMAVFGGRSRIASINSIIVPAASAVYILGCILFLILHSDGIMPAFGQIVTEAFGFSSVVGGFSGALMAHTLREGFARSLFSNEAGMGSSPLAYAAVETEDIDSQAEWGIFEIFFDSFIVSTLTALCMLSCGETDAGVMFGIPFGRVGTYAFLILCAVFAFASILSWCYYAENCIDFAFHKSKNARILYRTVFSMCALIGVYLSDSEIFGIADILNALMVFPNLFLLFKCRNEIERIR